MIRGVFRFFFRILFWICALIGFLLLLLFLFFYFSKIWPFELPPKALSEDSVLALHLNGQYVEHTDSRGIEALLLGKKASLYNLTRSIIHAAQDEKIKGIVVRIDEPDLGAAQLQELREALLTFRKTGKPSWCYSDSFGESSSGTGLYYLATACKDIWLQPLGIVNLTGLSMEMPFAKGALEKLEIKPEMVQRKEYKSYIEMFTRDDFSEPSREATQAIMDSILSQFVEGIAKERNLPHDQVRLLIDKGPYLTQEARTEKLVDRIDFRHNLYPLIKNKLGHHIQFIGIESYLTTLASKTSGGNVALIFGSGTIYRDGNDTPMADVTILANPTYKAFQAAIADHNVKAIVYRINSGGGSPIASETIHGIIQYAKTHAKKPVIISMSDAAASGGYWIAVAGSEIIAQPATLTGSIGVFGGKFVLSGFFDQLGIKFNHVSTSENANMWSMVQSYTPLQWNKLNALMDEIYNGFTLRVAKGRKMTSEQVEKVARGRVWTGEQALALGLVDQLGGLHMALELAKKGVGLPSDAGVKIFPEPQTVFESLSSLFSNEDEDTSGQAGIFGTFLRPIKKIVSVFTLLFSCQEALYAPLGEVK
jgi:protease-4